MSYLGFLGGIGVGGLVFLVLLAIVCAWMAAMFHEDYQELWRVARSRQFGLLAMFVLTSTVGAAMMLLRALGFEFEEPGVLSPGYAFGEGLRIGLFGSMALFVASAATGLGWVLFGAYLERGETQRLKERLRMPPPRLATPPPEPREPPPERESHDIPAA